MTHLVFENDFLKFLKSRAQRLGSKVDAVFGSDALILAFYAEPSRSLKYLTKTLKYLIFRFRQKFYFQD